MNENISNKQADYSNFSLVSGGLIYRLMTLSKKDRDPEKGLKRRAIQFTIIAWVPLFLLVLLDSYIAGNNLKLLDFLKDFEIQIRLLFVIPFLILVEKSINGSFVSYIKTSDNLINDSNQNRFDKLVSKLDRLTNLYLPEIIILIIIYGVLLYRFSYGSIEEYDKDYIINVKSNKLTFAGYYFFFISFPIFQLLLFRWVWRWIIWVYSVVVISRLDFEIEAVNMDKMAGLIYLNTVPLLFTLIFFSVSVMVASSFGYAIIYEGEGLKQYFLDIVFFIIVVPILVYLPLLFFIPLLLRVKNEGIENMGRVVAEHNFIYMNKWANGALPKDEKLLGSPDHSSLADINGAYDSVINMSIIPINIKMFIVSVALLLIPFIPLVFTYYSAIDLFKLVLGTAFE